MQKLNDADERDTNLYVRLNIYQFKLARRQHLHNPA